MSRSLGVLTLDLIARTGGFEQGMDRASRRVRSTAQDMEAAKRVADRYIMAIGAAGVAFASAAAAMAVSAAKSMDATAKMSQQIGTTTEALTGMRFAAQQFANIGDQQFDMAMRRMTRRIAEAAEGSGAAKNALDAMGLSARELARLSPDKQMLAIADAMQRTERQADRLRYTMAIFDTEGMALVPALQQGAAAFEQNIELAKRFGVVLSTEAAQAAEQFTSNMSLLTTAQEGFKNQLAEAVLPMLADLSGRLVEITQRIGPMGDAIEKALKAAGAAAAATAVIFVSRLVGSITASVTAWIAATAEAARYQMTLARMAAEAAKASTAITAMTGAAAGGMAVMGRAAQLALGVLGGPAGLLITAGLTAAAFLTMGRDARTAAVDVDELTESLNTLNKRQLESAAFNLENDLVELSKQAEEHGQILRTLNADYEALTERYGENYEGLRNVRQAIREEEESLESVIATIAKKSPLLAEITRRLWDMDAASRGAAGGVETLNQAMFSDAGEKYLAQIQGRIKALQDAGDPVKIASRYIAEHAELTEVDRVAIMSAAHAEKALQEARAASIRSTREATKALTEAQRAAQNFRREQDQSLRSQLQSVSAIHSQAQAIEDQIAVYGLGKTAIEDLTIARLEEQAAILSGFEGSQELVEAIKREIEARKRLRTAIGSLEQKEAERQAWEEWARDVEQIFDRVGQSLTDAIFDGGKSGKELLRDMFKSLTFNVLINPVVGAMQGWVTNQLGGLFGYQNPQQGGGILGTAQNLYSGYNAITGGLNSTFGNAAQWLGQKIGSEALTSFGLGLSGTTAATGIASIGAGLGASLGTSIGTSAAAMTTTTFSAAMGGGALIPGLGVGAAGGGVGAGIGAAGAAGGAAAGGAAGFGAAFGAALPWIGGALAIGGLLGGGLFDREPTTRRAQRARVDFTGGEYGVTSTDDRQPGAEAAIRQMAQQAVESANALMRQTGVDAAIDAFYAITESSIKGDRQGVASGGTLRIGDRLIGFGLREASDMTLAGFGGWSEAEMLSRLATDIQLSMLEAFQHAGASGELPRALYEMIEGVFIRGLDEAGAADLVARFTALAEGASAFLAAVEQMPFAELRDLSFDAAAAMVQFAGGLDNLLTAQQTYYERFYSDAERHAHAVDQLTQALAGVGVEMPELVGSTDDMLASYRALVEAQDLNTEEGQRAYVMLMQAAGAFADVAKFAGQAVDALDPLADALAPLREHLNAARSALALSTSLGSLADQLGGLLGLDRVYAARREQELWGLVGQGSLEQQAEVARELTDLVLARIDAERQANQQRLTTLRHELTTYRNLRDIGASLQNYLTSLESSSLAPYTLGEKVGKAEAELTRLVQAARGGDESALRQVQGALQNALKLWRDYGASGAEYQDAYRRLTGMVGDLAGRAVSEAEAQLMQLELQVESLESISDISESNLAQLRDLYTLTSAAADAAREQYQVAMTAADEQLQQLHLIGLDTARLHDIADLLGQLPASIAAQLQTGSLGYLASNPDVMGAFAQYGNGNASAFALQHYYDYGMLEGREFHGSRGEKYLLNNPDVLAAFFEYGANMSADEFARDHYEQFGKFEGRSYAVGTSYVPHDMLAQIHEGEIIVNPRDADILRRHGIRVQAQGNVEEIRALRQEMTRLTEVVERVGEAQVSATLQAADRNAEKVTAGVSDAVTRRDRDDLNKRKFTRTGTGAFA